MSINTTDIHDIDAIYSSLESANTSLEKLIHSMSTVVEKIQQSKENSLEITATMREKKNFKTQMNAIKKSEIQILQEEISQIRQIDKQIIKGFKLLMWIRLNYLGDIVGMFPGLSTTILSMITSSFKWIHKVEYNKGEHNLHQKNDLNYYDEYAEVGEIITGVFASIIGSYSRILEIGFSAADLGFNGVDEKKIIISLQELLETRKKLTQRIEGNYGVTESSSE